jgi:alpha-beta hydrolase superfamily lysophospholipase
LPVNEACYLLHPKNLEILTISIGDSMGTQSALHTSEVSWTVEGIPVYGTYTTPAAGGPFPAVAFVAGSGPTDRNWNTPLLPGTNGSGGLLAETLTRAGFATLRYDKRASGPHIQENMAQLMGKVSLQGHLAELAGAVRLLAGKPEINASQIFGLGNSEGCIHVTNYQVNGAGPKFAGIILTAPPANPIGKVAHNQIAAQLQATPDGQAQLAAYDRAIEDFVAGRQVTIDENLPKGMRDVLLAVTTPMNQPFSRELWVLDPTKLVSQVTAPVLIVIGKKDLQVNWQTEGAILESVAAQHANFHISFPENANHILKHETQSLQELSPVEVQNTYNSDETSLDPEAVQIIESWLAEQLQRLA